MIGLIGPKDSVDLALQVAADGAISEPIAPRAYQRVSEAVAAAKEMDPVCNVLLFTGRVPYVLARSTRSLHAILDFVPHSGVDLYRALVLILLEQGRLPRVSLDTIERAVAIETYADLGLAAPENILALDGLVEDPEGSVDAIAAFHVEAFRSGSVDLCLTCLGTVKEALIAQRIPVRRIEHTRSALRDALRRAELASRLVRSEGTQTAIAILEFARSEGDRSDRYQAERGRLRRRESALAYAESLRGSLVGLDDPTYVIHTTRAAVDAVLRSPPSSNSGDVTALNVGLGIGVTAAGAEANARKALSLAKHAGATRAVLPDGTIMEPRPGAEPKRIRLRETEMSAMALELKLGPLAFLRLLDALRLVDPSGVTARDLAEVYGIEPRSARRLLATLERNGLARRLGRQANVMVGRPQTIYQVDLARIVEPDL